MMPRSYSRGSYRKLLFPALLIFGALGGLYYRFHLVAPDKFPATVLTAKLLKPLLRLLVTLGLGLLVGQVIESLGWTKLLAQGIRPLTRWGRLKDECGAAFVSSFVSNVVANTMLMEYYEVGRVRARNLLQLLSSTTACLYTAHLPTTLFIVWSLVGRAGLVYLLITGVAASLRSFGALLYYRYAFAENKQGWSVVVEHIKSAPPKASTRILQRFSDRFLRLVSFTVPIFVLVFLVNEWGGFLWLRNSAARLIPASGIPVEAAGLVVFSLAAEFSSGMAAVGALVHSDALSVKEAAPALVLGAVISTPLRAIRYQLPTYAGLFNPALGTQIIAFIQSLRVINLLLTASPYVAIG